MSYTYDLNGNRLSKNEPGIFTLYFYDALNRMTSVITPDQHIKYVYDPFDRRLSKQNDQYLYDGQNEIGMFQGGKSQELRILSSNGSSEHGTAIAIKLADEVFIPIHDLFGNVAMLLSSSGEPFKTYRYSAFGKELNSESSDQNPWRFASKRLDPETGFVYFGRRYYDPEVALWTSPDPAEFVDGANFHAYLRNNPLYRLDAYGLWGESFWEGGFSYGSDFFHSAYGFGVSCCEIAGNTGQWLHADMEYEYGDDPSAFHSKMQSSWDEWGELTNHVKENPEIIGNVLAPACTYAYNLDENASFSDRFFAYSGATLEIGLAASFAYKSVSAIRGFKNASAVANAVKDKVKVGSQIWSSTKTRTSVQNAYRHWKDHGKEFSDIQNSKQYVEKTWEFIKSSPSGTLSKYRSNGDRILYEPKSNTFGIESAQGIPKTMFKPNPKFHQRRNNLEYFHDQ